MHVLGEVHPAAVILVEHAVHGVTEDAALGHLQLTARNVQGV